MTSRIQALRHERGWSQEDLARRAGVTRQLVGAVEVGRHLPSVRAAIGLARALGTTVEQLFTEDRPLGSDALGDPVPSGTPVNAARVGEHTVPVPMTHGLGPMEAWGVADAVWAQDGAEWLPDGVPAGLVIVGCDPIVGIMAGLTGLVGHRVLTMHASTGRSVEALAAGRVHGVVVHGRAGELPQPPLPVRRWHLARWQVGLASRAAAAPSIDELAERRPTIVQRDAGAGAQQALERVLRAAGADGQLPGPVGEGHIDVARRVSYGEGEAGVVMEPAATAFGLGFSPLEQHEVQLWLAEQWAGLTAAQAMLDVLNSQAFARRSRLLNGYDLVGCGAELSPLSPRDAA